MLKPTSGGRNLSRTESIDRIFTEEARPDTRAGAPTPTLRPPLGLTHALHSTTPTRKSLIPPLTLHPLAGEA